MSQQEKNNDNQQNPIAQNNSRNQNQSKQSIAQNGELTTKSKKTGKKWTENMDDNQPDDIPLNSLICFLCQEPIITVIEAICGHSFCEYCLSEYLLVCMNCPICGHKIRQKKGAANKRLDQIIQQFTNFLGNQAVHELAQRKKQRHKIKQQKKVENIVTGVQVDIRDEDYVWKKGRIVRTLNRICEHTRVKYMIVQYFESEKRQEFAPNSPRIARAGFYTNRTDIPKFKYQEDSIQSFSPVNGRKMFKKDKDEQSLQQEQEVLSQK